jgi:hypothetical protein
MINPQAKSCNDTRESVLAASFNPVERLWVFVMSLFWISLILMVDVSRLTGIRQAAETSPLRTYCGISAQDLP